MWQEIFPEILMIKYIARDIAGNVVELSPIIIINQQYSCQFKRKKYDILLLYLFFVKISS